MEVLSERAKRLHQGAIRAMFDKASAMENVINMGIGEPDIPTPIPICEAAGQALKAGKTHYTPNAGTLDCRRAVAAYSSLKPFAYDPAEEIIITPGGMGALALFIAVTVDPGDEVLIQDPQWLNYASQIRFFGGIPVPVPTHADTGFTLDPDDIERSITERTKVLMLNSPNNPTGRIIGHEQLAEIAKIVRKYDLLVVSDEVYNTLCYEKEAESICAMPDMKKRTVVINSLSKAFAMTGWRLGYAAGRAEIIKKMTQAQENISACANVAAQEAAVFALQHPELSREIRRLFAGRREKIMAALDMIPGISYYKPDGAFYIFPDIRAFGLSSREFCERLLDEEHVVCIPGSAFGSCGEGHIRMAYTCDDETIDEAMIRIRRFCNRLKEGEA